MRAAALIAALACASLVGIGGAAHAESARESRYGPAPDRASTPMNGRAPGYTGAAYGGRALGWAGKREIVAPQAQDAAQAQPWWVRPVPAAQPQPAVYQPQTPAPPAREPPQSIYDAPPPAAAPVAYAPPAQPVQPTGFQPGQVGVRTYSVGRQFGMAPDPIPAAGPPRMVLIAAPASAPQDEDKPTDDRDWQAKTDKDGAP